MTQVAYDLREASLDAVRALCERHHGYGTLGHVAAYCWGVYEDGVLVAGYAWQPPPPGAARGVCPEAPAAVLALSRMVAVPRTARRLRHVSKPLRRQMVRLIDRTRWPVLVTYSDEGQGHTGHVYKCSGWTPTLKAERVYYVDESGRRLSVYANGKSGERNLKRGGTTTLQRWEHWECLRGGVEEWMAFHGWRRVAVPGKRWRSGAQAYTYERESRLQLRLFAGGAE